ncbi:putative protein K02A2.6-like [Crotalus adamanteus]|uniref:Integrase catalytic domain-containing protein n=1 Tax=Crotalus adamanteus TaxID=8729 RepID=A0AAW1BAA3_CROAD
MKYAYCVTERKREEEEEEEEEVEEEEVVVEEEEEEDRNKGRRDSSELCFVARDLQQKIFAKEDVSFQDALREVAAEEAAGGAVKALWLTKNPPDTATVHQEDAQEGSEADPEEEVNRLHRPAERRQKGHLDKAPASLQCFGCGGRHKRADCRFRSAICRACGRQGHIASVCLGCQKVQPCEELLLKDNGPQFTSFEFQAFLQANLIRHATSAPFHPSSNGLAERMVRTTKDALKKLTYGNWHHSLVGEQVGQAASPALRRSQQAKCPPKHLRDFVRLLSNHEGPSYGAPE